MTPTESKRSDATAQALAVLADAASIHRLWNTDWQDGGLNDSPKSALRRFNDATAGAKEAHAHLTRLLAAADALAEAQAEVDAAFSAPPDEYRILSAMNKRSRALTAYQEAKK